MRRRKEKIPFLSSFSLHFSLPYLSSFFSYRIVLSLSPPLYPCPPDNLCSITDASMHLPLYHSHLTATQSSLQFQWLRCLDIWCAANDFFFSQSLSVFVCILLPPSRQTTTFPVVSTASPISFPLTEGPRNYYKQTWSALNTAPGPVPGPYIMSISSDFH